jgi:hypothetical protein
VAVWVATRAAQTVTLSILKTSAGPPLATATAATIQIGAFVHVALVEADISSASLDNATVYYYDLTFSGGAGLRAAGIMSPPGVTPPTTILGYASNPNNVGLPSFVLPASDLAKLRICQGSCRKPHADSIDTIAVLDADIGANFANLGPTGTSPARPQQLFLTGDQIYADDVADSLMALIQEVALTYIGDETFNGVPRADPRLRTGFRAPYVHDVVKFTTDPEVPKTQLAKSHLLRYSEFCAMYLLNWSPVLWPTTGASPPTPALPDFTDIYFPADQFPETVSDLDVTTDSPLFAEFNRENEGLTSFLRTLPAIRRALANVATYMLVDDHEVADDFYLDRLWVSNIIASAEGKTAIRNGLLAYAIFQGWGNVPSPQVGAGASPLLPLVQKAGEWFTQAFALDGGALSAINTQLRIPQRLDPDNSAAFVPFSDGVSAPVAWNYALAFDSYEVIALDMRSHRLYPGGDRSGLAPAALIDPAVLTTQLPSVTSDPNDPFANPNIQLTILITPAPWSTLSLVESSQRGAKSADDVLDKDVEVLHLDAPAYDGLVARCAERRNNSRIVLFCGDVHHAYVTQVKYWARSENPLVASPPRDTRAVFAQIISSAIRNQDVSAKLISTLAAHFAGFKGNVRDITRLGWRSFGAVGELNVGLATVPVVDPNTGTPVTKQVEWDVLLQRNNTAVMELTDVVDRYLTIIPTTQIGWRMRNTLVDGDPRGAQVNPVSAAGDFLLGLIEAFAQWLFGYVAVARGGREIVGVNNIAFLTLDWGAGDAKSAIHDIRWFNKSYDELYDDQAGGTLDLVGGALTHTRVTIPLPLEQMPSDDPINLAALPH